MKHARRHPFLLIVISLLLTAPAGIVIASNQPSNTPVADNPTVKVSRTIARLPPESRQSAQRYTIAAFSPDGKRVASLGSDRAIGLWDVESGRKLQALPILRKETFDVQFSPDGLQLATAGYEGIKLWDLKAGKESRTFREEKMIFATRICFSSDGKRLAGAHSNGVTIWEVRTSRRLPGFQPQPRLWSSAAIFSPDGRYLARTGHDGKARVWNTETGKELFAIEKPLGRYSAAFSPDGKQLATVVTGRITLWDWRNRKMIRQIRDGVYTVEFNRNGKWLLAPARDHSIVLWNVATGKKLLAFEGHTNRVFSAIFSPDGRRIVSTSKDGTVRLWRVPTSLLSGGAARRSGKPQQALKQEYWPKWRSLHRDKRSMETEFMQSWPKDGPPLLWQVKGLWE